MRTCPYSCRCCMRTSILSRRCLKSREMFGFDFRRFIGSVRTPLPRPPVALKPRPTALCVGVVFRARCGLCCAYVTVKR